LAQGKPQQSACIARSNRTVRHEWLDQHIIEVDGTLGDCRQSPVGQWAAQDFAARWLWTCNNDRPNLDADGITPPRKVKTTA
jgi:putative transposase